MIVGRDTQGLDEPEILRAVIETVSENMSDGVIAPLFYLALLGPAGMAAYKAANTLDSMVGHKNERYKDLGWASARLDDVLNYIPARVTCTARLDSRSADRNERGALVTHHLSRRQLAAEPEFRLARGCIRRSAWRSAWRHESLPGCSGVTRRTSATLFSQSRSESTVGPGSCFTCHACC